MTNDEFKELIHRRLNHCVNVMAGKSDEYSRNDDKLHNFKVAAAFDCCTPEKALWGMMLKHIVSLRDIVQDIENGNRPQVLVVVEKITDTINYTLLLEALIDERLKDGR
jgi:RecA/RadA recombinase